MAHQKQRTTLAVLFWLLTAAWLVFIWCCSAQAGAESAAVSGGLTRRLARLTIPSADASMLEWLDHILRKAAHVAEFAVLACLAVHAMYFSELPHPVHMAFLLSLTAAIADECHQLFVPGRAGMLGDVAIDAVGVGFGLFLYALLRRLLRLRRKRTG